MSQSQERKVRFRGISSTVSGPRFSTVKRFWSSCRLSLRLSHRRRGIFYMQFLLLGGVSVALNTIANLVAVFLPGAVAHKLKGNPGFTRKERTASGAGTIGLGVYVATSR